MQGHLILAVVVCICLKPVIVSASPGQACDSLFCPDLEELWRLPGVLIDQFQGSPTPTDDRTLYPQAPPATESDFELEIVAPMPGQDECKAFAANPQSQSQDSWDSQGGSESTNFRPCEAAVGQLIWSRGCGNTEQNERTAAILSGMDSGYETSIDPLCEVKGGVSYWFAKLTQDQIKALEADITAIRAVMPNPSYDFGKVNMKLSSAGAPASNKKRTRLKKRLPVEVVEQYTKDESLRFLSTAPGQPYSTRYSYFSEAGAGVRVYMVDTGLNHLSEFDGCRIEWLYALDATRVEDDEPLSATENTAALYQDGTCVGSKILGVSYGVAKRVNLIVVKTKPHLASFVNAITLIINHIRATWPTLVPRGRVVINIRGGYQPHTAEEKQILVAEMEKYFRELVVEIQAVVVVAAGENTEGSSPIASSINTYPALFAENLYILSVGAVMASASGSKNGQLWPWSKGSDTAILAARVYAPGDGWCVNHNGLEEWTAGQGISTATVSGLVAYFLSLPNLLESLSPYEDLPKAIVKFLQKIGYARSKGGPITVWNGIDSEDSQLKFDNWVQPSGGFLP